MRKCVRSTRFMVRLNFEKELKSTVWGREFHQFISRSLKKLARIVYAVCGLALEELNPLMGTGNYSAHRII